jgi:hypothetical protein
VTESEWRTGDDADRMLVFARRRKVRVGLREQRLLACALCRLIWDRLDAAWREAVEAAEAFADGAVGEAALAAAHGKAVARHRRPTPSGRAVWPGGADWSEAKFAWEAAEGASRPRRPQPGKTLFAVHVCLADVAAAPPAPLADVLRDVIGNPFRRGAPDPRWLTPTAVGLARAIYDERAFDRLPILGDALEDAGCDNPDLLAHCRGTGRHVRGCWAVDLLHGKV